MGEARWGSRGSGISYDITQGQYHTLVHIIFKKVRYSLSKLTRYRVAFLFVSFVFLGRAVKRVLAAVNPLLSFVLSLVRVLPGHFSQLCGCCPPRGWIPLVASGALVISGDPWQNGHRAAPPCVCHVVHVPHVQRARAVTVQVRQSEAEARQLFFLLPAAVVEAWLLRPVSSRICRTFETVRARGGRGGGELLKSRHMSSAGNE